MAVKAGGKVKERMIGTDNAFKYLCTCMYFTHRHNTIICYTHVCVVCKLSESQEKRIVERLKLKF